MDGTSAIGMHLGCDLDADFVILNSNPPAHTLWLTLLVDVVDSDVDAVTGAVAVVDLAVEAARTRRRNGAHPLRSVIWSSR